MTEKEYWQLIPLLDMIQHSYDNDQGHRAEEVRKSIEAAKSWATSKYNRKRKSSKRSV